MLVQNLLGTYFDKQDTILELALCSTRECVMESLPDPSCLGTPVSAIDKSIFRKYKTYLRLNQVTIVHQLVLYMKAFWALSAIH